jgi:class 3 adenylate cyclase
VIECGGQPNQFVGDGELALFGLNTNPQTACRQALQAAALIATNIDELNQFLSHDLLEPIRFGIGIHGDEVIIGDIGYRDHHVFTALGDAVNVAARLQDMTKGLECEVILSEEVYKTAGLPVNLLPEQELPIRGRAVPLTVRVVANAQDVVLTENRHRRLGKSCAHSRDQIISGNVVCAFGIGLPAAPAHCLFAIAEFCVAGALPETPHLNYFTEICS